MTLTVNENIKRIRKERGLTQKRLGEICGIAEPNIRKYENGKQNPKLETVEKIASALGVSAFELMGVEYFDLKNPDAGKQYAEYNSFQNYLRSLGYAVKEELDGSQEESTLCSYVITGNGISVVLSGKEYDQLQSSTGDLLFSFLWKKQQQKKK